MAEIKDNVVIFPLIKRDKDNKKINEIQKEDIEKISVYYMEQLRLICQNYGISQDKIFYRDFNLVYESFKSALLRSGGYHHKLQEYVDHLEIMSNLKGIGKPEGKPE